MKIGDKVYIIENNSVVTAGIIHSISANLYLLKLDTGKAVRLPRHRLYQIRSDAEAAIEPERRTRRTPYDYM